MIHLLGMVLCVGGFLSIGAGEVVGRRFLRHIGLGVFGAGLAVLLFAFTAALSDG